MSGAVEYLFNSLAHPTNTVEAKIRQAILSGDVAELRLALESASLSANDAAIAQRALATMESVGSGDASMLAQRYGIDWANKVDHVFGSVREGPIKDALLNKFGSPGEAFAGVQRAVDAVHPSGNFFTGSFTTNVNVQGIGVTVRGYISNGIARIGTIEKW